MKKSLLDSLLLIHRRTILSCIHPSRYTHPVRPPFVLHKSLHHSYHCHSMSTHSTTYITLDLLKQQTAETSNALIQHWKDSADFIKLSTYEGDLTMTRDEEDGVKLQKGIDFAKVKGVIDPNFVPEPYVYIDVLGKTPDTVADEILAKVKEDTTTGTHPAGDATSTAAGSVIVLCGLSGTGKGTTVETLRQKLEDEEGKQVVTWSNGNIFRSVTLLAVTWCEQNVEGGTFDKVKALTKENLQSFVDMLTFGKFEGQYDTRIQGLGLDMLISKVQNTELKSPKVSINIPTVAEVTQGTNEWHRFLEYMLGLLTYPCVLRQVKSFCLQRQPLRLWERMVYLSFWKVANKRSTMYEHPPDLFWN
jgi:hypothetical protein